jgi:hypothetical protein
MENTLLRRLGATGVSAEFVNRRMTRSRSRRVVLLLDCCYAGAFERGMTARAGSGVGIETQFGGRGRAVITASSAMEYAFEGDELTDSTEGRPSVFTNALVTGLETGDADRDQDGLIGLDELYDYVYDKVRTATPNQTPGKWMFGVEGELVIAHRSSPITSPAPLPAELHEAIDSPFVAVRVAAVHELARLIRGRRLGRLGALADRDPGRRRRRSLVRPGRERQHVARPRAGVSGRSGSGSPYRGGGDNAPDTSDSGDRASSTVRGLLAGRVDRGWCIGGRLLHRIRKPVRTDPARAADARCSPLAIGSRCLIPLASAAFTRVSILLTSHPPVVVHGAHDPDHKSFIVVLDGTNRCHGGYGCEYSAMRPQNTHVDFIGVDVYHPALEDRAGDRHLAGLLRGAQTFLPDADRRGTGHDPCPWAQMVPAPAFDFTYTWGHQSDACPTLVDANGHHGYPDLQSVMRTHNTS